MPIVADQYVSPTWDNGTTPAIDETELQAMSDSIVTNQANIATLDDTMTDVEAAVAENAGDIDALETAVTNTQTAITAAILVATNVTVTTGAWAADATFVDYPFKAVITLTGATTSHIPTVTFGVNEALNGNYAPVANITTTNNVNIYAKLVPSGSIVLPSITAIKHTATF